MVFIDVDTSRAGRAEEPDSYRLRDRNGLPIVCFQCGKSSMSPPEQAPEAPKRPRRAVAIKSASADSGQSMVSCDYCYLHWHLDCIDPPMSGLPSFGRKWMCPAHADQVTVRFWYLTTIQILLTTFTPQHVKRRIPKQNNTLIDITRPGQRNNGNLEIIPAVQPPVDRVETDDLVINGRRYRIPERIITLDFWNKLSRPLTRSDEWV
jgi:hypothetical protein